MTTAQGPEHVTDTTGRVAIRRASHAGYVHAVVAALTHHGIQASQIHLHATPTRTAVVDITDPDPISPMWTSADWVRLSWHEDLGWAVQVRWPGEPQPRAPMAFQITAAPPPADLAAWVAMCLIHPEIAVREDDNPIITPNLEEVLRRHPATNAG
jgi:hypothetical protein